MKHIDYLKGLDACKEAVEYAKGFPTSQKTWDACERGDWMLWILGQQSGESKSKKRKKLVFTTCQCARLTLKYVKKGEDRPRIAIETAEAYCEGKATIEEVRAAANAAYAAANAAANAAYAAYAAAYAATYAADAAYAAYAADAATYAADAADAATYAANAANAATYAANAANAAADATTKTKILKKCADIVRKQYPKIRMA